MTSPTELAVRDILREAGRPLTTAEIGQELAKRVKLTAKDPRSSARAVLNYNQAIVSVARGTYVYTRTAVTGAAVRDRLRLTSVKGGYVAVGAELIGLLWPGFGYDEKPRTPRLFLDDGPEVNVSWGQNRFRVGHVDDPYGVLKLPAPFWSWWEAHRAAGADEILVRCEDGAAGRYRVTAIRRDELDPEAVRASTEAARAEAGEALRGGDRGSSLDMLALRLVVRAPYAGEIPPDPLPTLLLLPYPRFALLGLGRIEYRPDLTPAFARLLQDRLLAPWIRAEERIRAELRLSPATMPSSDEIIDSLAPDLDAWLQPGLALPVTEVVQAIRLRVDLLNLPGISRTIDVRDDQTLVDVHDAIQDAFGWDNDHLWAFNLGHRRDELTSIETSSPWGGTPLPEPDDVVLAELGLKPKSTLTYVFDFGDNWMHELKVVGIDPADSGAYPRLVASEGDNPVQYPRNDEDYDEEDAEDEDGWIGDWGDEGFALAGLDPLLASPFGLYPPAEVQTILDALGIEVPNLNDLSGFDLPAPDPALRPLPIDLNLLVPAFELIPPGPLYLDAERGDLVIVPPDDTPRTSILRETIEGAPDRYIRVPEASGERQHAAMVAFTDGLPDGRLKARLGAAVAHPSGVDRWYRALERDPDVADRWNDETGRRIVGDALAWLAEHGITPIPPVAPEPAPAQSPDTPSVLDTLPRSVSKPSKPRPKKRRR